MSADGSLPDLEILPLASVRDEELVRLARNSLGEGPASRTVDYWRWKHQENPFGRSLGLVARDGDKLVGMRVFLRWNWLASGTLMPAIRAVDTATHPSYRRRGLFRMLTTEALRMARDDGVELVFNTPNRHSLPGYLKMGWKRVCRVPLMFRLVRPLQALVGRTGTIRDNAFAPGAQVSELLRRPDLDPLLDSREHDSRLQTPLTRQYLRWRFADVPGIEYRALWDLHAGGGAAIVHRVRPRAGRQELSVAQLILGPGDIQRAAALLRGLLRESAAGYVVACAARATPEYSALLRAGFLPVPASGPTLVVRQLGEAPGRAPTLWRNWRLSVADLEIF